MRLVLVIQHIVVFVLLCALYALLAGEVSSTEIAAGLPLVLAASLLLAAQRRTAQRRWSHHVPAKALYKPLLAIVPDTLKVGKVLLASIFRRPAGAAGFILRQPFHSGGNATRPGVTQLGLSLAPNAFVVGQTDEALLLHCLAPRQPSTDAEWPS